MPGCGSGTKHSAEDTLALVALIFDLGYFDAKWTRINDKGVNPLRSEPGRSSLGQIDWINLRDDVIILILVKGS